MYMTTNEPCHVILMLYKIVKLACFSDKLTSFSLRNKDNNINIDLGAGANSYYET